MIYTNELSIFILNHHHIRICNINLRSIQEIMRTSKPTFEKYKKVCDNFTNLAILTKSSTPGKVQLTFIHASVGNKSLGESVAVFTLEGSLDSPSVFFMDTTIAFATDGTKICLPITEVLICAAASDLMQSKRQQD